MAAALLLVVGGVGAPVVGRTKAAPPTSPVRFRDGVLETGEARVRLGQAGDVVVTGHWRCGPATVALLRPATGEVFRFEDWARPGHDAVATAVATIPGAAALRAAPAGTPGCDELEVVRGDGRPVRLAVAG